MLFKRIRKIISRILLHPRLFAAKLKGIYPSHCSSCLIAEELLGKPVKTFIDVGSNVGNFINAVKYVFPGVRIYAFEPVARLFSGLKKIKGVTAFNIGLWDQNKEDIFYYNKKNEDDGSFLEPTEDYKKTNKIENEIFRDKIKKVRFDKLDIEIKRPCFVKIDVEGGEDRVLRGFGKRLNEIDIIQVECFFKDFHLGQMKIENVISFLRKYGFNGFIQKDISYENGKPASCDLIFFRDQNMGSKNI